MNPTFNHCKDCDLFDKCYDRDPTDPDVIVGGPNYIEPACGEAPYKKE